MRRIIAFYAWQSDRVEDHHRHLIRFALDKAAERINADQSIGVELVIDSDTEGLPGTPRVSDAILAKIDKCDIFIPDLTFVTQTQEGKQIPNPNVLTEYGYALKSRTVEALMPVMNVAFGPPERLPFDMGHLRHPIQYEIPPDATDDQRRQVRDKLSRKLEKVLRAQIAATQPLPPPPKSFVARDPKDGPGRFRAAGEALGLRWNIPSLPRSPPEQEIRLPEGAVHWLRLMPDRDPGTTWPIHVLKDTAIGKVPGSLVSPVEGDSFALRAADGMGFCYLTTPTDPLTPSVAFAFESGEVWAIDMGLLRHQNTILIEPIEKMWPDRLLRYARFLGALGVPPPYRWIAGLTGVKGWMLVAPPPPGMMRIRGSSSATCVAETVTNSGLYDGAGEPRVALSPFFSTIYDKCGLQRPPD